MANSLRRNSFSSVPSTSHCDKCQVDIEFNPQSGRRPRLLCPFCGEYLIRPNLPDFQQIKRDIEKKTKDDNIQRSSSLRARFSRTFNRVILRRDSSTNNNGITASHRQNKPMSNVKMPPIGKKLPINEETMKENLSSSSLPVIATASSFNTIYDCESFQDLIDGENSDHEQIMSFFSMFYSSFNYMIQTLTTGPDAKQIDWSYLQIIHDYIGKNSDNISRLILRKIASCCVREVRFCFSNHNQQWRSAGDTTLKAYTVLLLAPVFDDASNNHIYAHLLRRVEHLTDREHQEMVLLLRTLPATIFRSTVRRLQTFVSVNLFPSRADKNASPLANGWWIPSAIRTLALFNVTNEQLNRKPMSYDEFVIDLLDDIDIQFEYRLWLRKSQR